MNLRCVNQNLTIEELFPKDYDALQCPVTIYFPTTYDTFDTVCIRIPKKVEVDGETILLSNQKENGVFLHDEETLQLVTRWIIIIKNMVFDVDDSLPDDLSNQYWLTFHMRLEDALTSCNLFYTLDKSSDLPDFFSKLAMCRLHDFN